LINRALLGLSVLACLGACAHVPQPPRDAFWQGRMSLTVHQTPVQHVSAAFELEGNANEGELTLFSPLGHASLVLRWSPGLAQWLQNGQTRSFANLSEMTQAATGTDLPLGALFEWLAGRDLDVPGWTIERTGSAGPWSAKRHRPEPAVTLMVSPTP
jgi:outer membrane lipoprotein LolB